MKKNYRTEQEQFWAGGFGDEYIKRNMDPELLASNINFFAQILKNTRDVKSIMEYGAHIGWNLIAIRYLLPEVEFGAVEINKKAIDHLKKIKGVKAFHESILDFKIDKKRDFVFTKGVLIHINPEKLKDVYQLLYDSSSRYICLCEYYNPSPVSIPYRGQKDQLFKRDFAGEMLDAYKDLCLLDYGFAYHRDNNFSQDDITWFLMERALPQGEKK
ncbi:MAG: pseudaminic acid biosynthesis-associated methylase [Spirochaetes bacterium]|nr:pseudaminic acid biosynthesis-associated methylase [Spirochaetota bacterium]